MKIVKLNRRYKQFRENGHTMALRFESYDSKKVPAYENACRERLGGTGWNRQANWWSGFGSPNRGNTHRPFWITFRNESELTLVLLSTDLTK